jgi:hypothetical protein
MTLFGITIDALRRGPRCTRTVDLTDMGFILSHVLKQAALRGSEIPPNMKRLVELNKGRVK